MERKLPFRPLYLVLPADLLETLENTEHEAAAADGGYYCARRLPSHGFVDLRRLFEADHGQTAKISIDLSAYLEGTHDARDEKT